MRLQSWLIQGYKLTLQPYPKFKQLILSVIPHAPSESQLSPQELIFLRPFDIHPCTAPIPLDRNTPIEF